MRAGLQICLPLLLSVTAFKVHLCIRWLFAPIDLFKHCFLFKFLLMDQSLQLQTKLFLLIQSPSVFDVSEGYYDNSGEGDYCDQSAYCDGDDCHISNSLLFDLREGFVLALLVSILALRRWVLLKVSCFSVVSVFPLCRRGIT